MEIQIGKRYIINCGVGEEHALVTGIVGPGLYEGEFYVEGDAGWPGIVERSEFIREADDDRK
jgi:hypothetical protein